MASTITASPSCSACNCLRLLANSLACAENVQTRIVTHYSNRRAGGKPPKDGETLPDSRPPRARLVLKTYDPVSGACLKYRTSKAAEVSRLVQMLGILGRRMSALPLDNEALLDSAPPAEPVQIAEGGVSANQAGQQQPQQQSGGGGAAKAKKKKGKR